MNDYLLLALAIGLGTVTFRGFFILVLRGSAPGGLIGDALSLVPAAVLAALIAPALLMPQGSLDLSLDNAGPIAGLVALAVAWRTGNMILTLGAGLIAATLVMVL